MKSKIKVFGAIVCTAIFVCCFKTDTTYAEDSGYFLYEETENLMQQAISENNQNKNICEELQINYKININKDNDDYNKYLYQILQDLINTDSKIEEHKVCDNNEMNAKASLSHAAAALHNVYYIVQFTRLNDGGYKAVYIIRDTYDFDYNNYQNFEMDFGNNYCLAMQQNGWIKKFDIDIIYRF